MKDVVLIVDDDFQVGQVLEALLRAANIGAVVVSSGSAALSVLESGSRIDAVISDLQMPEMDGMQLLQRIVAGWPEIPVLMLTGFGTVPLAVEAMKAGAADFLLKPVQNSEVLYCVQKALTRSEKASAPESSASAGQPMVGASAAIAETQNLIRRAAGGMATVLLRGESGTGKEVAARAIHEGSARRAGPFVKVHCAALPEALLESELFGYVKGAFTGAAHRKPGRVELAAGGVLFLDEIGDVSLSVQVKLLRLLQDKEFEPLGSSTTYRADVRIVAATHRPLEQMIRRGEFREDLFYRLNVVSIRMPTLRERGEDIELLARHFGKVLAAANGKSELRFSDAALGRLRSFDWPGNVRQLQNLVERLIVLRDGATVGAEDIQRELDMDAALFAADPDSGPRRGLGRDQIVDALNRALGNRTLAAKLLGVSRRTLYNKLEEFQLHDVEPTSPAR